VPPSPRRDTRLARTSDGCGGRTARRTGGPVVLEGYLPSYRSAPDGRLPDGSRPVGIEPPTEVALDRPTWNRSGPRTGHG
ncbi:hypothetical protein ACSNOH_19980, partial [Streptomyces sp. URMC 127]